MIWTLFGATTGSFLNYLFVEYQKDNVLLRDATLLAAYISLILLGLRLDLAVPYVGCLGLSFFITIPKNQHQRFVFLILGAVIYSFFIAAKSAPVVYWSFFDSTVVPYFIWMSLQAVIFMGLGFLLIPNKKRLSDTPSFLSLCLWLLIFSQTLFAQPAVLFLEHWKHILELSIGFAAVYAVGRSYPSYFFESRLLRFILMGLSLYLAQLGYWLFLFWWVIFLLSHEYIVSFISQKISEPLVKECLSYASELGLCLISYVVFKSQKILLYHFWYVGFLDYWL